MAMTELTAQQRKDKQEVISNIKSSISLDHNSIAKYGNTISNKLSDFSSEILKNIKVKDSPEVEQLLLTLVGQLNSIDCKSLQSKKPNMFQKLFGKTDPATFIARFESVDAFIEGVVKKLNDAEFTLGKSINTCELYLEQNRQYIAELDLYIEAGKQYIEEAKAEYEAMKAEVDANDMLAVNELSVLESQIRQFEKKVHNLDIQRTVAIQNIPQLMLIKEGDSVLVEKIRASIEISIPLWESQMVIAVEILRQENGAKLVKSITDTNNELLKKNADLLNQSSVMVAQELERDIIDLETLQHTNEKLISTIQEIREIRNNGQKNREAVAQELTSIQNKLIETTMNSGWGDTAQTVPTIDTSKGVHPLRYSLPKGRK